MICYLYSYILVPVTRYYVFSSKIYGVESMWFYFFCYFFCWPFFFFYGDWRQKVEMDCCEIDDDDVIRLFDTRHRPLTWPSLSYTPTNYRVEYRQRTDVFFAPPYFLIGAKQLQFFLWNRRDLPVPGKRIPNPLVHSPVYHTCPKWRLPEPRQPQ